MKEKCKISLVCISNAQTRFKFFSSRAKRFAELLLQKIKAQYTVNIIFTSDAQIKRFNRLFHKTNRATDVLAFEPPAGWKFKAGKRIFLGEVIVSLDRAKANARRFCVSFDEEIARCVIHGILHLLGERDGTPAEKKRMFSRQEKLLESLKPIPSLILKSSR